MTQNSYPSRPPANEGTMSGMLDTVIRKKMEQVETQLPARIVAYNRSTNMATVQPLVSVLTTNNVVVTRAQIASVPVLALGGGNFVVNFPLQPGDLGWIEASDRDISLYVSTLSETTPNTRRIHSFEDALFIPDIMREYTIAGADADRMVIQHTSGSSRIAIGADSVEITTTNFNVASTTFTHNGVNVGEDHLHSGVVVGGSNTGEPVT